MFFSIMQKPHLLSLALLLSLSAPLGSESYFEVEKRELNPGIIFPRAGLSLVPGESQGDLMATARELSIWGRSRNMFLMADCPNFEQQNHLARIIPAEGIEFELPAPGQSRLFLYLDMVSFRPLSNYAPHSDAQPCNTGQNSVVFKSLKGAQFSKVRWLEVIVNGHVVTTIYQGGGSYIQSPLKIVLEREHLINRELKVKLRPSPGENFFAIWDAYITPES